MQRSLLYVLTLLLALLGVAGSLSGAPVSPDHHYRLQSYMFPNGSSGNGATALSFWFDLSADGNTAVFRQMDQERALIISTRSNGVWTHRQLNEFRDNSLALSGDGNTLVLLDNTGLNVYTRAGADWVLQQQIQRIDVFRFHLRLSDDGNTLLVNGGYDSDRVYIFARSNQVWTLQQTILHTRARQVFDLSGDGQTAFIADAVYRRSGSTWVRELALSSTQIFSSADLSDDGNLLVVSAKLSQNSQQSALDFARVYARVGGVWTLQGELNPNDDRSQYQYGFSVAVSGDGSTILVHAGFHTQPTSGCCASIVFVFNRINGIWTEYQRLAQGYGGMTSTALSTAFKLSDNAQTIVMLESGMSGGVFVFGVAPGSAVNQTPIPTPTIVTLPVNANILTNGEFSAGMQGWENFGGMTNAVQHGVLHARRGSAPAGAGFFQRLYPTFPAGTLMEASLSIGSGASYPQMVTLTLHGAGSPFQKVCWFRIPAGLPPRRFVMQSRIDIAMSQLLLSVWIEPPAQGSENVLYFDNVDLRQRPELQLNTTICRSDVPVNTNLIFDGAFDQGLSNWALFGGASGGVVNGVLNLARSGADGGFYQFNPNPVNADMPLEYSMDMGNTADVFRSITMIVRGEDWADLRTCYVTLPPNAPQRRYTMRLRTSQYWSNVVVQGWLLQNDGVAGLQLDNLDLRYRPDLVLSEILECPNSGAPLADSRAGTGEGGIVASPPPPAVVEEAKP